MKLFKSLLVAPATLGLLAPISATANEINLNDISNYSKSNIELNSSSFDFITPQDSKLISGGEGLVDIVEDSFSSTTSASFGSTFYVGSVDGGLNEGVTTFTYDFSLGLETSFTGEDSLAVAIIGGNGMGALNEVDGFMSSESTADVLTLDGIAYTFPLGGFTITAGDGVGVDDLNAGACAYSAFTDLLGDCGTPNVGGQADSAVAASYDFGNGFTIAAGIGGGGQSAAVPAVTQTTATVRITDAAVAGADPAANDNAAAKATKIAAQTVDAIVTEDAVVTAAIPAAPNGFLSDQDASTVALELAYTADTFGISAAYTDDDADGTEGTYYSFQAAFTPDAPYSISAGMEFDDSDASSYFVGLSSDVGVGSLSVGMATKTLAADHADNLQYELAYSYPVNDGMTITPGVFLAETAGAADDEFGIVVTTSFSF